jgi:surface protein
MRKSKNILLLIMFLLCGVISYGQSITWDAAAGTIRCEGVAIGTTATVTTDLGDRSVEVVDRTGLIALRNASADLSCVCTSNITDMSSLFNSKTTFNQDIGRWDTSNVTDMNLMFRKAWRFNQNISNWDVSSVENMQDMFSNADDFNNGEATNTGSNPLTDVSSGTDFDDMFYYATSFNQDIGSWDVSSGIDSAA